MSFQNAFFSRNQIVCIIFHERSSFCIFYALSHNLHNTYHGCCFPVTFATETVSFFHQTLDCQSRKLLQSTQISEMCYDRLIIFLLQETLKSDLNACLDCDMFAELFFISAL